MPQYLTPDQMLLAIMVQQGPTERLKGDDSNFSKSLTMAHREMLQWVHEKVHTDDMHHFGFIEARLPWVGLHELLLVSRDRKS